VADSMAEREWEAAARRQSEVQRNVDQLSRIQSPDPVYQGRRLSQWLRNEETAGTGQPGLQELLTLTAVSTGQGPETITFEVPVRHDALTNLGTLHLFVDRIPDDDSDAGVNGGFFELKRATNGTCLVVWRTIYESPGPHTLRLGLELNETDDESAPILGPVASFVVSNLCQFSVTSATFDPRFGATLRAKLPESNGTYSATMLSPAGDRLKTISGTTTNGIIKLHWDLTNEEGRRCTNESFDTVFQITLPESGRSQTLKGP
jgi:hypothetical protein